MSSTGRPIIPRLDLTNVIKRNIAKEKRLSEQEMKEAAEAAEAANSTAILLAMLNVPPKEPIYQEPTKKKAVILPSLKTTVIYKAINNKPAKASTVKLKQPTLLPSMTKKSF